MKKPKIKSTNLDPVILESVEQIKAPEYLLNLKHFKSHEFACSCCGKPLMDEHTINCLVNLREKEGKPIHINSAYRCEEHNKNIGGKVNSYHCKGMAVDIRRDDRDIEKFKKLAEYCGFNGFGLYSNFIHIDTRKMPSFWRG